MTSSKEKHLDILIKTYEEKKKGLNQVLAENDKFKNQVIIKHKLIYVPLFS